MTQEILRSVEFTQLKKEVPQFKVGDTVKVKVLIREGKKERTQAFEGMVIAIKGGGVNQSFIVRRIFQGVAIERTFLMHSPKVTEVKVLRKGKTRRAKLYFMRKLIGTKATRLKEDTLRITKDFQEMAANELAAATNAETVNLEEDTNTEAEDKA